MFLVVQDDTRSVEDGPEGIQCSSRGRGGCARGSWRSQTLRPPPPTEGAPARERDRRQPSATTPGAWSPGSDVELINKASSKGRVRTISHRPRVRRDTARVRLRRFTGERGRAGTGEQEEYRRAEMRDPAREEQRGGRLGHVRWILPGHSEEVAGVIERHEDHDQAADHVDRVEACAGAIPADPTRLHSVAPGQWTFASALTAHAVPAAETHWSAPCGKPLSKYPGWGPIATSRTKTHPEAACAEGTRRRDGPLDRWPARCRFRGGR